MEDADILNLMEDAKEKKVLGLPSSSSDTAVFVNADQSISQVPPPGSVKIRKFHTITEFRVYPNGTIYPQKTVAWFEDKIYPVSKKEKPKAKIVQKTIIKEQESY